MNNQKGWQRRKVWLVLRCTLFILHCTLNPVSAQSANVISGTWIGVHAEWATDFVCPLPTFLELKSDNTLRIGMTDGSATSQTGRWWVRNDTLQLDTLKYAPGQWTLAGDVLRIGTLYPMVFRRLQDVAINLEQARKHLAGGVWQTDSLTYRLHENGKVCRHNPRTGETTAHCWKLAQHGASVFLVMQGNAYTCDGNYLPAWQVTSLKTNEFSAIGGQGKTIGTVLFRAVGMLSAGDSCRATGFQTCDNCFERMYSRTVYSTSEKMYEIRRLVKRQFKPVADSTQSGLIQIHFDVNCRGQVGRFRVTEWNEQYQPCPFPAVLTDQITKICRDEIAPNWLSKQKNQRERDESVTLSFRIKQGKIDDIFQ